MPELALLLTRHLTLHHFSAGNRNHCPELTILSVKMGWQMIIKKHFNDNPIKPAYFWHRTKIC